MYYYQLTVIKIDASSLIYSIKLSLFKKIKEFYKEIIISPAVKEEVIDKGKLKGKADAIIAENYLLQDLIKIHTPKRIIKNLNLGEGEVEIFSLSIEENCPCIIDDTQAQRIGIRLNIDLKSTPIILLELLKNNFITLEGYERYLENYGKIANISQTEYWLYKKLGELIK